MRALCLPEFVVCVLSSENCARGFRENLPAPKRARRALACTGSSISSYRRRRNRASNLEFVFFVCGCCGLFGELLTIRNVFFMLLLMLIDSMVSGCCGAAGSVASGEKRDAYECRTFDPSEHFCVLDNVCC